MIPCSDGENLPRKINQRPCLLLCRPSKNPKDPILKTLGGVQLGVVRRFATIDDLSLPLALTVATVYPLGSRQVQGRQFRGYRIH